MGNTAIPSGLGSTITGAISTLNTNCAKFIDTSNVLGSQGGSWGSLSGTSWTPTQDGVYCGHVGLAQNSWFYLKLNDTSIVSMNNPGVQNWVPIYPIFVKKGQTLNMSSNGSIYLVAKGYGLVS